MRAASQFRLTGRDAELAQFGRALDRLGEGDREPQLIELSGEPGIGKTRLLTEMAQLARRRGVPAVLGHATEYERNMPFRLFAGVFTLMETSARTDGDSRAALDVVLRGDESAAGAGLDHYRLHVALRRIVASAVGPSGLLVMLDDLHWADEASLELLSHFLRDPLPSVAVAVTYRTAQAPAKLSIALSQARMATTRAELGRLDAGDITGLLPGIPPNRLATLIAASDGNPLYLDSLARLDDRTLRTLADPARTGAAQIPARLQSLLTHEFAALDNAQRLVAHSIAVAGEPAHLDVVACIAGTDEDEVSVRVDELVAAGIIGPTGSGFSFRHPLIRAAAYQSAGPAWRISAHRHVASYLERHGGPLWLRAHHTARAARYGDQAAIGTLTAAATAAVDAAPAIAVEWLRVALRILPERDDTATQRGELMLGLARALQLSGELAASRVLLHEILALSSFRRGPVVRLLAITERLLGEYDQAHARVEAELGPQRRVHDYFSGAHLAIYTSLHMFRSRHADAAKYSNELIVAARRLGDDDLLVVGHTLAGLAALALGDVPTARSELAMAVPLIDAFPDARLRDHLQLLSVLAWLELNLERYDDAHRHLRRGLAIARFDGHSHAMPYLCVIATALAVRRGRLDRAAEYAADAVATSQQIGSAETLSWARGIELQPALWRLGPEAALERLHTLEAGALPRSSWWAETTTAFGTVIRLGAGDAAACLQAIERMPAASALLAPQIWASQAVAAARLGRPDEALRAAGQAVDAAAAIGLAFPRGVAGLAYAQVLTESGRAAEAVVAARTAMQDFRDAAAPLHEALAREALAEALAETGDLQPARSELGIAKSMYAACQATWLVTRATRAEAKLGARATRGTSGDPGVLGAVSARESEVALLAAKGLTNREIAERLYLSTKTVDAHLSRAFTKLGVRSRVELTALVSQGPGTATS